MKLVSLSSGSSGNCYLVQGSQGQSVLIDCGLSASSVKRYLAQNGVDIASLSGIFLTHEHGDHLRGAGTISQRWGIPIFANARTLEVARPRWEKLTRLELQRIEMYKRLAEESAAELSERDTPETEPEVLQNLEAAKAIYSKGRKIAGPAENKFNLQPLTTGSSISFDGLEISSFPVSHDATETVCYTIRENGSQATILTDLGCATEPIFEPLCNSDLIILEANHEVEKLTASRYPYSLKARILGERGHLSNKQSAEILIEVIRRSSPAHTVWLAHLSQENNDPANAKRYIQNELERHEIHKLQLQVALRDRPSLQWNGEAARYQMTMF